MLEFQNDLFSEKRKRSIFRRKNQIISFSANKLLNFDFKAVFKPFGERNRPT